METLDATDLELIVFADECDCEALHHEDGPACSVSVTHAVNIRCFDGLRYRKICGSAAEHIIASINDNCYCQDCGMDCWACWTIRPI